MQVFKCRHIEHGGTNVSYFTKCSMKIILGLYWHSYDDNVLPYYRCFLIKVKGEWDEV